MRIRGKHKVPGLLAQAGALMIDPGSWQWPANHEFSRHFMEIGCGRGAFICTLAARHTEDWFLAIDKYTPIVARAAAMATERGLTNIRFFDGDLEQLQDLAPSRSLDGIFLNFSDPWPRRRNERKRLTHERLLALYQNWLKPSGFLEFKTDNEEFFDWSLRSLERAAWRVTREERGLPTTAPPDRAQEAAFIQTEYEAKFRAQNLTIYHLRAAPNA